MLRPAPRTLVEGLRTLPPGEERGFRFRGLDGNDSYYPFEALRREATRRAAGLLGLGFLKGDRLALVIAEPQEFVLTFLGAVLAGVVPVPIYPRASFKARNAYVQTVAHIVEAAGARGVCTMAATREVVDEVLAGGTRVEKLVILEEFLQHEPSPIELPTVEPDDLCFLQFTSGSTSMPKGVMVTHENLVANAACFLGERGLDRRQDDVAITWLPLYHDMGLIGFVLGTILFDIPTVLLPTEAFARRPSMWMEAMSRYGGTITFAPNFAYGLAAKRARDKDLAELDLSRVRIAGCGAEPINADVMRRFTERFAPVGFKPEALLPCYGMAEATLAITFCAHDEAVKTDRVDAEAMRGGRAEPVGEGDALELVCCGRGFPDHTLRVVDERGEPVAERAVGEIVCRGPSVTPGYYENPEATAEGYRDGWLHTGDLGYMVADELYVCGRIKDLIIIRGANFYPQDIEWAVAAVEGVRRDNVIAFSVMQGGEEQLVVAAEGNSSDAPRLRTAIATKVAETTGLQAGHVAVVRVGTLPKTSSGKVQRRRAKALFEQGELEEHRE